MGTLINVCGADRSGTTMLDLMLGNSADAFSCGEVYAWFRPWRKHHFDIDCDCGKKPCPIWSKLKNLPDNKFHATVIDKLQMQFVIDSSKELCWVLDSQVWAIENNFKVVNLIIWKDPISLAFSYWKRKGNLLLWKKKFIRYHKSIIEAKIPFIAVNHNDLSSNPQVKLAEICNAVGMPYFKGKEQFWEKTHHHLFGSAGTRKQVTAGNSVIRASDKFSAEFENHRDFIKKQINSTPAIKRIIDDLRKADVSLQGSTAQIPAFIPSRPYPYWYYVRKMRNRTLRLYAKFS